MATGALGASTAAYSLALGVEPSDINAAWERAPVAPRMGAAPFRVPRAGA